MSDVLGARPGSIFEDLPASNEPVRKRPPGSGRKAGTPNKVNRNIRELIITKGKPAEFLCAVVRGRRIKRGSGDWVLPTLADQLKAAELLLKRISPELSAMAVQVHEDLTPSIDTFSRAGQIETARTIAFMLRKGVDAKHELEEAERLASLNPEKSVP